MTTDQLLYKLRGIPGAIDQLLHELHGIQGALADGHNALAMMRVTEFICEAKITRAAARANDLKALNNPAIPNRG